MSLASRNRCHCFDDAQPFGGFRRGGLDLDQRQAAELFGGGVNALSRFENGKAKPPLAWSNCSTCWTVIPTISVKSGPPKRATQSS